MSDAKTAVVATSVYESARPFLKDWVDAVNALNWPSVVVAIANDGLEDAPGAFSKLRWPVKIRRSAPKTSIPRVRELMMGLCREYRAAGQGDFAVFCDADDVLLPDAVRLHSAALANAEISFGDLVIVDERGYQERILDLARAAGPRLDRFSLDRFNVCGFSNTAVRIDELRFGFIWDDLVAVDWWLFSTLLCRGNEAQHCGTPVAKYRQHPASTLGAQAATDQETVRRRTECAMRHYQWAPRTHHTGRHVERLRSFLRDDARMAAAAARAIVPDGWFSDVAQWLDIEAAPLALD